LSTFSRGASLTNSNETEISCLDNADRSSVYLINPAAV